MEQFANIFIIIRSAGERTEHLCKQLIFDQGVPAEQVSIVKEVPFSAALRKSFELGMEKGLKWTFCVDADVLLRPDSIKKILEVAEQQEEHVCEIQAFVMDKFFGGPRPAGNHLYRTGLLHKAIELIPAEGTDIRPESYLLNQLALIGHPFVSIDYIVGIHDDEQYYFDIFRKCFVQAFKHEERYNLFMKIWKEGANHDYDYHVALKGFAAGVMSTHVVFINKELEMFKKAFEATEISEKQPMRGEELTLDMVERKIIRWNYSELYLKMFPDSNSIAATPSRKKITQCEKLHLIRNRSKIAYYTYRLGTLVKKIGSRIQLMAE